MGWCASLAGLSRRGEVWICDTVRDMIWVSGDEARRDGRLMSTCDLNVMTCYMGLIA